jgi:hypothetical protein
MTKLYDKGKAASGAGGRYVHAVEPAALDKMVPGILPAMNGQEDARI